MNSQKPSVQLQSAVSCLSAQSNTVVQERSQTPSVSPVPLPVESTTAAVDEPEPEPEPELELEPPLELEPEELDEELELEDSEVVVGEVVVDADVLLCSWAGTLGRSSAQPTIDISMMKGDTSLEFVRMRLKS